MKQEPSGLVVSEDACARCWVRLVKYWCHYSFFQVRICVIMSAWISDDRGSFH